MPIENLVCTFIKKVLLVCHWWNNEHHGLFFQCKSTQWEGYYIISWWCHDVMISIVSTEFINLETLDQLFPRKNRTISLVSTEFIKLETLDQLLSRTKNLMSSSLLQTSWKWVFVERTKISNITFCLCSTRSNVCVMRCVPEMICCRVIREQGLKKSKKPFYSHPPSWMFHNRSM